MTKNNTASTWVFLSLLIIVIDQISKYCVVHFISATQTVKIFSFLNFILRYNAGAAFSFLGSASGWQIYLLSGISIAVAIVLIVWLSRLPRSEWLTAVPISLVIGGALGNLIDRVHYGYVIDFIDFHIKTWHYATFNVADSAVCVGATWLILRLLYESFVHESK